MYNGALAYTDAEFGRLLGELDTLGIRNNTIVVLTADHGESFLDHGGFEHGHTLYNELLHVPLIMSWPGQLPPAVVQHTVGLIDVAPTLCAQTGVKSASSFAGHNLFGDNDAPLAQSRPVLVEGNFWGPPLLGLVDGGFKLIITPERLMLFNLRADPRGASGSEQSSAAAREEDALGPWKKPAIVRLAHDRRRRMPAPPGGPV